jgi:uncharacterized protein with von Willebrand factor type A (vWA) domain
MISPILKFVECCRAAGYRISTAEVIDCIEQLELVDVLDEVEFRAALRANFAKSRRDQAHFDRLYHLFFHELRGDLSEEEGIAQKAGQVIEALREQLNGDRSHNAVIEFLSGDPLMFLEMMRHIQTENDTSSFGMKFNLGPLASRLKVMVTLNRVHEEIDQFLQRNPFQINSSMRRDLARYFSEYLQSAYALLLKEPRPHTDDQRGFKTHEKHLLELGERPFASLTAREIEEVREVLDKLVRKLKDIISRRYATNRRGVLDVKKTLRRAARYQGVPVEIMFKNRPPKKAKIVTLCDISSSVWSAARFMLNVLYSLHECFEKVNSFVFVSGVKEVTDIFDDNEPNHAIEMILKDLDFNYYVSTDYGETFRQFRNDHMDVLTKRTTLIIMGDARTNYLHPEDMILGEMRERCRRVIWLNPEPMSSWNTGDSEMYAYKQYCHELRQCRNLNQLIEFIEELML